MLPDRAIMVSALLSIQLLSLLKRNIVIGRLNFTGHQTASIFTGTDQNGPMYQIWPDCAGRAMLQ